MKHERVQSSVEGFYMEEETKLTAIFASSPDAITVTDLNGNITECNQATLDMGGFSSKDEVIGKSAFEFIAEKDHKRALENLKRTLEQGSVRDIEYTFLAKDGREYPAELSASVVKDSSGKPIGFVAITKDITERKKVEEALQKSREFAENLILSMKDGFSILDSQGVHLNVNRALCRMTGFTREELIGVGPPHPYWPEEEYGNIERAFQKTLRREFEDFELIFKRKDGERFPVIVSPSWITDREGNVISYFATVKDITERKKIEEKLKQSEGKFRNIFESANDCMALLDRSGRILDVNRRSVEMYGGSKEELVGKHFTRIGVFSPKDIPRAMSAFTKLLAGKKTTVEVRIKNKKSQEADVEVSASLMKIDGEFASVLVLARDITERKKAEDRIRESEEKYRNLFENARDVIITFDLKGNITSINKAVEEYGFKKDEMIRKNMLKFVSKKYWPRLLKELAKIARGKPVEGEIGLVTPKGEKIAGYRSNPIRRGKKVVGFQTIMRDITERKRTEEALRESEKRLRQLIEYAPDGIYINDLNGNFVDGNKQAEKMIGYKKEELIGKNMLEVGLLPEKYIPKAFEAREKTLRGQRFGPEEFELMRKDGSTVTVEISSFPVKRERKFEVINIARDITERKEMEEKVRQYSEKLEELVQKRTEELLESEKRYSVLVEEASDGVLILQDEKIAFANKTASEIVGYSRDELIGLPFEKMVDEKHRQSVNERCMRRLREEEIPTTYEMELITKTGERVPVELSCARISYQGRPAILQIVRDIKERKRMEEQRLKLEKLAAIGEVATMVGHDLRNPLQSIENATYYLNSLSCIC